MKRLATTLIALTLFSACGGSGTNRIELLNDARVAVFEEFIEGNEPTNLNTLMDQGTATYAGGFLAFGGVGPNDPETRDIRVAFVGESEITVDFADQSLSGTADQFQNVANATAFNGQFDNASFEPGAAVAGVLTIDGAISSDDPELFAVRLSGELQDPDGAFFRYSDAGGIAGVFGPYADALGVRGGVNVTFDGEPGYIAYSTNLAQRQ